MKLIALGINQNNGFKQIKVLEDVYEYIFEFYIGDTLRNAQSTDDCERYMEYLEGQNYYFNRIVRGDDK